MQNKIDTLKVYFVSNEQGIISGKNNTLFNDDIKSVKSDYWTIY